MSTPKINFFIQAGHRGIFTGPCPGPVRASDKQLFGLSPRQLPGTGFRRAAGMSPGKIRGTPRCAQRVMTPNPNNCSRSRNPEVAIPNPDGTITRTIYRFNPEARAGDPEVRSRTPNIPNIFRWRAEARPRQTIQLLRWTFAIRCYWDLFGFYGNFCWCNVFHAIFSTIHKFLQLFYDLIPRQAVDIFVGYMATSYH